MLKIFHGYIDQFMLIFSANGDKSWSWKQVITWYQVLLQKFRIVLGYQPIVRRPTAPHAGAPFAVSRLAGGDAMRSGPSSAVWFSSLADVATWPQVLRDLDQWLKRCLISWLMVNNGWYMLVKQRAGLKILCSSQCSFHEPWKTFGWW